MPWQPMQVLALVRPLSGFPPASDTGVASSASTAAAQRTVLIMIAPELIFDRGMGPVAGALCSGKTPFQSINKAIVPPSLEGGSGMAIPVTVALAAFCGLLLV